MTVSRALTVRLLLLAVLVAVAATLGIPSLTRLAKFRAVDQVCKAVERGQWQAVLDESRPLLGADPEGLRAAECRCRALLETGEERACVELLEGFLSDPEVGDWLPEPLMTGLLVARRETRGDLLGAAELAHQGAARYPSSALLQTQELVLRSRTEDERSVLEEMRRRTEDGDAQGRAVDFLRLRISELYLAREEWEESLELLGDGPDEFPEEAWDSWLKVATQAVAGLGQDARLRDLFDDWRRRGGGTRSTCGLATL